MPSRGRIHPDIIAIMDETGADNAEAAVRMKAREFVRTFYQLFGEAPPFSMQAMASFRDLHHSAEPPRHSEDSEIAPESDGRIVLRVNRERPRTRQRFSIGHEIGHTFFPSFKLGVRCRKPANRDWSDPDDYLETLCDVAASELLFPEPWFHERVGQLDLSAEAIYSLASDYKASPDATVRRLVEVFRAPLAVLFLSWKLKPVEIQEKAADRQQLKMFVEDDLAETQPKLRVDYAIVNDGFSSAYCTHIPCDKSVSIEGVIYEASRTQGCCDGTMWLDLGTCSGDFRVHAIPVYTPGELVGPNHCISVAAVLNPIRKGATNAP